MIRTIVQMRDVTVAIQLRTKSLLPKADLMFAFDKISFSDPLYLVNTDSAVPEAAIKRIEAIAEVIAPVSRARGSEKRLRIKVKKVRSSAMMYPMAKNHAVFSYGERPLNESFRELEPSSKSRRGSKLNPIFLVQVSPPARPEVQ